MMSELGGRVCSETRGAYPNHCAESGAHISHMDMSICKRQVCENADRLFLGIDTSCYTTSLAAVDSSGRVVFDNRIPLEVREGGKGLRQSEMVFQHIKHLPCIADGAPNIAAVAASARPRPVEGSYMPVFMVSDAVGSLIAALLQVPYYPLTHQHGHVGASLIGNETEGDVLCVHVSGGTTEVLRTNIQNGIVGDISIVGGTKDIAIGQLVDRVAAKLGLPFPGGAPLEQLAVEGNAFPVKLSVLDTWANISGIEAQLMRAIGDREPADIAASALKASAETLAKLIDNALREQCLSRVLLAGGVMRNLYIREYLRTRLKSAAVFANVEYSSDNACGLAAQARNIYFNAKGEL